MADDKGAFRTQLTLDQGILAFSLATSLIYLTTARASASVSRMITKASSTALLSVLSLSKNGPSLLTYALALGSLGDAFLAYDHDSESYFLCGLVSFLLAHLLYIKLFISTGGGSVTKFMGGGDSLLMSEDGRWRMYTAVMLVGLFAPVMLWKLLPKVKGDLRAPIVVYTSVIVCMDLAALSTVGDIWVVVGALMFTASDGILAVHKFLVGPEGGRHNVWMPFAVWVLYYGGQGMIALGVLA
ncbi:YhhN-like protein [Apodospora peruviana]|uniref:YhhN-like protein n=1 Tax=Apodospora peruviana TaxID=516989 RepID=A0AAE0M362_9PEZI|nr:YhhN-like protein [Apodospora peruviana]